MENTREINERLRRANYSRQYWSLTSSMIIAELYAIRTNLNQGQADIAKLKIDSLLHTVIREGDKRNSVIEFIEGLITFHALPRASKIVSK